jgi:hypothetical protein
MKLISECSRIIVTGSIAYDDIMNFPGYFKDHFHPEKLHQINISFVVDKLDIGRNSDQYFFQLHSGH